MSLLSQLYQNQKQTIYLSHYPSENKTAALCHIHEVADMMQIVNPCFSKNKPTKFLNNKSI
jgi:hypothetical protein